MTDSELCTILIILLNILPKDKIRLERIWWEYMCGCLNKASTKWKSWLWKFHFIFTSLCYVSWLTNMLNIINYYNATAMGALFHGNIKDSNNDHVQVCLDAIHVSFCDTKHAPPQHLPQACLVSQWLNLLAGKISLNSAHKLRFFLTHLRLVRVNMYLWDTTKWLKCYVTYVSNRPWFLASQVGVLIVFVWLLVVIKPEMFG